MRRRFTREQKTTIIYGVAIVRTKSLFVFFDRAIIRK